MILSSHDFTKKNRAAAYSQLNKHPEAIDDAKKASEVDPSFSKAYSRLGHALFCSSRYQEAVEAYEKGLELDPNVCNTEPIPLHTFIICAYDMSYLSQNTSMKSSLETARSRAQNDSALNASSRDGESDGAGGGFPNFGAGGGMPVSKTANKQIK